MSNYVLDASAVLACLNREPGGDRVMEIISECVISSVNLSEVVARMADAGRTQTEISDFLMAFGFEVVNFDADMAYRAGMLRPLTRQAGLSFGDRACLALAQSLGLPVLTSDRNWAGLDLGIEIQLIR